MKKSIKAAGWSPIQMGLARTSKPALSRLVPKKALASTKVILDMGVGGMLAIGLYTLVSPRCILPNTPVASHPEAALILGLLASGAYWFATGENVTSVSGAAATAVIYGMCKLGFGQ
jgi:hypothetical protein